MTRLTALNPETTTGKSKELFDGVQSKLGKVPNIMRTMGNSPAVLEGYLNFSGSLGKSKIGAKLSELIALTVANLNNCQYCASVHSYLAEKAAGVEKEVVAKALNLQPISEKIDAALNFSRILVQNRGKVSDAELDTLKAAGYSEEETTEIIAHVGLNIFTNYFNHVADTEVDFPLVDIKQSITV